ncbi:MAG: MgtC/SapB family protein [Clostridiales bacterium]|nr:MgtC/SapB family protein [Clostridiales bacterium]
MGGILGISNKIYTTLHEFNIISIFVRLLLAMFLSGMIGVDRGMRKKVIGVKTYMVLCIGATLVMMTGEYIHLYSNGAGTGDTARLGAQVVSGISFLGAGSIMVQGQRHVSGLTTAASLWSSACIGLAIGIGFYSGAILATVAILVVLRYSHFLDNYIQQHSNTYDVYMEFENEDKMATAIRKLKEIDINVSNVIIVKKKTKTPTVVVQATLEGAHWKAEHTVFREVRQMEGVISVEEI